MTRHRITFAIMILAGWILIGLSFTLNYYLYADHYVAIFKQQPSLGQMLLWELPYWFLWAAITPLIFWLTRRFRIGRQNWLRNSAVQLAACLVLSILHRAFYLLIGWVIGVAVYQQLGSVFEVFNFLFFFNLPTGFLSYVAIVFVSHVVSYYHEFQKEELLAADLRTQLAHAELQATEAQLQALKMQLQPHFLFNTLNSISSLLDDDVEAAELMISRLGDFLRLTLENAGAQEVSLQEELEFLKCYLEIERVRFQDRLTIDLQIDDETLVASVPNLILQPIVENAIRHGILHRTEPGRIAISSVRTNETLRLKVIDNGPGMHFDDLRSVERLKKGVGLTNTRARLEQLYGKNQKLLLADGADGGLAVTVEIPFKNCATQDGGAIR